MAAHGVELPGGLIALRWRGLVGVFCGSRLRFLGWLVFFGDGLGRQQRAGLLFCPRLDTPLQNPKKLAKWLDQVFQGIWASMMRTAGVNAGILRHVNPGDVIEVGTSHFYDPAVVVQYRGGPSTESPYDKGVLVARKSQPSATAWMYPQAGKLMFELTGKSPEPVKVLRLTGQTGKVVHHKG